MTMTRHRICRQKTNLLRGGEAQHEFRNALGKRLLAQRALRVTTRLHRLFFRGYVLHNSSVVFRRYSETRSNFMERDALRRITSPAFARFLSAGPTSSTSGN